MHHAFLHHACHIMLAACIMLSCILVTELVVRALA
jgi:hypothetical protein